MQIVSPTKVFDNLLANNNNNYVLPQPIIEQIAVLFDCIGFSNNTQNTYVNQYNAAPTHKPAPTEYDGRANFLKQQARKQQPPAWKTKPAFAVTKFALLDENENNIDELRIELNKITEKTLDTRISKIIELLNTIIETSSNNSDDNAIPPYINDAFTMFFETAITNKNPVLYANFFKIIYENFKDFMSTFMQQTYNAYVASFNNIVDVPESDYNDFCDFTAANARRKNISALFAKIAVSNFIEGWNKDFMETLLTNLFTQVIEKVEIKQKQKEVEEITENIVMLITSLGTFIDKTVYTHFVENINSMKPAEKPGLTSRTKFKYMDLRA